MGADHESCKVVPIPMQEGSGKPVRCIGNHAMLNTIHEFDLGLLQLIRQQFRGLQCIHNGVAPGKDTEARALNPVKMQEVLLGM